MKFSHKHNIPAQAKAAWEMTSDPDFVLASYKKANATHELIHSEERDGKTFNKIRVSFNDALPSIASKFIGSSNLSYEQHEVVDHVNMRNDWEIIVPKVQSKVKATVKQHPLMSNTTSFLSARPHPRCALSHPNWACPHPHLI